MFQLFLQGLFQFASAGVLEVSVSSRPVSYNNFLKWFNWFCVKYDFINKSCIVFSLHWGLWKKQIVKWSDKSLLKIAKTISENVINFHCCFSCDSSGFINC